jgi:hypothetical protein
MPPPTGVSASSPSAPVPAASGSSMNSLPNTARRLPPALPTLSSITRKPRPTTTTQATASPSRVASDAVVAARVPARADAVSGPRPLAPGPHPCDASCRKSPPDASHNLEPPPQPIEKQELTASQIKIPHAPNRCVTHPGDASCQKPPPDASPNFDHTPQPIEKEKLTASQIKIPHTPNRCVTRAACSAALTTPVPGVGRWLNEP